MKTIKKFCAGKKHIKKKHFLYIVKPAIASNNYKISL